LDFWLLAESVSALVAPSLFGLKHTNRNLSDKEAWGKNQFNSEFPASLACYMDSIGLAPVYLGLNDKLKVSHGRIPVADVFGLKADSPDLFFGFEEKFEPYEQYVTSVLPRVDLVTFKGSGMKNPLNPIEIKLTALPDNSTAWTNDDSQYGCEIVVRPDSIVYVALSIAKKYRDSRNELKEHLRFPGQKTLDYANEESISKLVGIMADNLDFALLAKIQSQSPFLLQPVWKTQGKLLQLHDNCFDVFVWSDFAFTRLFVDTARRKVSKNISRHMRSVVWLYKMLSDFAESGQIDHEDVIAKIAYNVRNDKAFALGGQSTHSYMKCAELEKPRVGREALKEIILGHGEKLLSPERRLDAAILSTPDVFDSD
jgi:hypothetical protein